MWSIDAIRVLKLHLMQDCLSRPKISYMNIVENFFLNWDIGLCDHRFHCMHGFDFWASEPLGFFFRAPFG